jgi:hypothetical protein
MPSQAITALACDASPRISVAAIYKCRYGVDAVCQVISRTVRVALRDSGGWDSVVSGCNDEPKAARISLLVI